MLKELKDSSFAKSIEGSYRYALEVRKDGHLERLKKFFQREKDRAAKKGRARNLFGKIWKCVGYLIVIIGILTVIGPMIAMNYIRTHIKSGEWGGDFNAEDYINKYNYTAPPE